MSLRKRETHRRRRRRVCERERGESGSTPSIDSALQQHDVCASE